MEDAEENVIESIRGPNPPAHDGYRAEPESKCEIRNDIRVVIKVAINPEQNGATRSQRENLMKKLVRDNIELLLRGNLADENGRCDVCYVKKSSKLQDRHEITYQIDYKPTCSVCYGCF